RREEPQPGGTRQGGGVGGGERAAQDLPLQPQVDDPRPLAHRPCHGRERNGGGQAQGGGEGVDGEEHLEELVHGRPSLVPAASAPAAAWCRAVLPAAHRPARWRSRVKRAGAETKRITSPWTTVIRSAGMRAKSCMERPP